MKEMARVLSPTDQLIVFLEEIKDPKQLERMKHYLAEDGNWERNMIQSGVDVDYVRERIRRR